MAGHIHVARVEPICTDAHFDLPQQRGVDATCPPGVCGSSVIVVARAAQVELTRAEYEEAHRKATERDRTMTVCDVCGVFMTSTDSEARREVRKATSGAVLHDAGFRVFK